MDLFFENIILLILIIIQSIFGIGLLLFGTPTFLIIGYDFLNTLNFLLPISIVISFLQLINYKRPFKKIIFDYNLFCLPFLILFLIIALNFKDILNFKVYAAVILIISSIFGGVGTLPEPFPLPPPGGAPHGLPPLPLKSSDICKLI